MKTACKACRQPFYVDATRGALKVSVRPPSNHVHLSSLPPAQTDSSPKIPSAAFVPGEAPDAALALEPGDLLRRRRSSPPPLPRGSHSAARVEATNSASETLLPRVPARAASLIEEELPTRPLNERPFSDSEAPSPFYEPPPTSRSLSMPPLPTQASPALLEALAARRPSRFRPIFAAALLFGAAFACTLALWPTMSGWVERVTERSSTVVPSAETTVAVLPASKQEQLAALPPDLVVERAEPSVAAVVSIPAVSVGPDGAAAGVASHDAATSERAVVAATPDRPNRPESDPATEPSGAPSPAVEPSRAAAFSGAPAPAEVVPAVPEDAAATPSQADEDAPSEAAPLGPFDTTAAATALSVAALQSGSCRKAGDPTGMARVVVTFAPSGRVTSSTVSGAPFAGTSTGGCIASQFRAARVPAFDGALITVTKSVVVE